MTQETEREALIKSLRIKADMIRMGERITWGSETELMYQAADALEALQGQALSATAAADAKYLPVIEKLVEALEFAKINLNDFRGCIYDRDDDDIKTQEKIAEALALAAPLLEKKGEV